MDPSTSSPLETGGEGTALALTCEQVREMLPQFKNGILEKAPARSVEMHVATCSACSRELRLLRAEDELLIEALSDLKPDVSFRSRVAKMCGEVLAGAHRVANSVPERKWATIRWALAFIAVIHFALLSIILDPPASGMAVQGMDVVREGSAHAGDMSWTEWISSSFWSVVEARSNYYWINLFLFLLSLFLLIGGRLFATLESRLASRFGDSGRDGPSRLEVLALETLGICGALATSAYHHHLLMLQ